MKISNLKIKNFRGIREGNVQFKKHPVLIGGNNTGKTTLIEALTLLLGRDRLIRELTEHDFYGSNPQPADRIKIVATISDFPGDDPDASSDWFREGRAVPKWLDESTGAVHPLRSNLKWSLCCQIGVQARFDQDSLSVEVVRYFHDHDNPIDPFSDDAPVGIPIRLIQQLGFFLVRASRTWDKIFSWGSELFRRTVSTAAAQPSTAILAERDRLRSPEQPIEQDHRIQPLINSVNLEIGRCIPNAPSIQLRVTATDSRSVMEAVSAHFSVEQGVSIPAARQGSGLISLQGLMLLLELGRARAADGEEFILALEEPELHLPPATQKQLVQRVQALSTQTFITTHSPTIAAMADPTSVMVLRNTEGKLTAEPFLDCALTSEAPNWKRKTFQQNRVDVLSALLHTTVLIPEGKSEFYLLRSILRSLMLVEGWNSNLDRDLSLEVGLIPTEDSSVIETHRMLTKIHDRVCCVLDGDADGLRYINILLTEQNRPYAIIRWQDNATIENVVGWMLLADEEAVIPAFNEIAEALTSVSDLINWLKLKSNKANILAYEVLAEIIANNIKTRSRATEMCVGLASACAGIETQRFQRDLSGVWVFQL
ncbi:MAG: chromosome partitioning protein [Verrucomicrobiaceae bacterium]|nr:chromosome partitioning protein [Verrucomicrobiaceae bacterium]